MHTLTAAALVLSLLLTPSAVLAAPHRKATPELTAAKATVATAKAELAKAKAAEKLARHRARLAKAKAAAAKAWVAVCVDERTGPTDGLSVEEATDVCTTEAEGR